MLLVAHPADLTADRAAAPSPRPVPVTSDVRPAPSASPASRRHPARLLRGALALGVVLAGAAAAGLATVQPAAAADPELARLLLGMAAVKGLLTLAGAGAVAWRLGQPTPRGVAVAYLAGVWLMAGATVLIAQLALIPAAAVIFHVGELGLLYTAWRDHALERRQDA